MTTHSIAYRTILAGVALQAKGHPAVLRAVDLARRAGGHVTLVHATEEAREDAEYRLRELQVRYPEINGFELIRGRTWVALNDVAAARKAELIVVGAHVHGQLLALLGAVSDHVLHHTRRDVLVVRSERYGEGHPPAGYSRVIVATDLRGHAQVARAAMLARLHGASLTLLHVIGHYPVDRENDDITPENQDPVTYQKQLQGQRLQQTAEAAGWPDALCEVVVTHDAVQDAVPAYAKASGADLLVLGAHDQAGIDKLLGSTADGIVHQAPCDVLVARG